MTGIAKYFGFVKNNDNVYYVATDEFGKVISIYSLTEQMKVNGIYGTKIYVNYVIDTKYLYRSVLFAMNQGVIDIEKFM